MTSILKFYSTSLKVEEPLKADKMKGKKFMTTTVYQVIDNYTKSMVGTYLNKAKAKTKRDKLDRKVGVSRYSLHIVDV